MPAGAATAAANTATVRPAGHDDINSNPTDLDRARDQYYSIVRMFVLDFGGFLGNVVSGNPLLALVYLVDEVRGIFSFCS